MPFPFPGLPEWSEVLAQCQHLDLGMSPAELHGGLAGWLAGGGSTAGDWLHTVLADTGIASGGESGALGQLFQATRQQLIDPDFGFHLLLPGDEASLWERSDALFAWCRGFVGGFGMALGERQILSDEGQDVLADLVRLSAESGQSEGDENDELALMELEEFVRVATLLLHQECTPPPPPPPQRSVH